MTDDEYTALIDKITDEHFEVNGICGNCIADWPCATMRCADALHDARAELDIRAHNTASVTVRVDAIIALDDSERQHAQEDQLLRDVITTCAPAGVVAEIDRLTAADFERWYA